MTADRIFCDFSVYALRLFLDRFGIASGVLSPTLPVAAREQQIQVSIADAAFRLM